jgi:DNA-directed RNA polymerase specialized sigma24 family protein
MTPEQTDEAEHLYASGLSLARIAERFDVTAKTVHARLRERGVRFRDTQSRPLIT